MAVGYTFLELRIATSSCILASCFLRTGISNGETSALSSLRMFLSKLSIANVSDIANRLVAALPVCVRTKCLPFLATAATHRTTASEEVFAAECTALRAFAIGEMVPAKMAAFGAQSTQTVSA